MKNTGRTISALKKSVQPDVDNTALLQLKEKLPDR